MKAIILAACHGTRMRSNTHKVMNPILGKPLLQYVTDACKDAGVTDITLVVSQGNDDIRAAMKKAYQDIRPIPEFRYTVQTERAGTGHAVQAAAGHIRPEDDVLIVAGDMPLITAGFVREFADFYAAKNCSGVVTVNTCIYLFKGAVLLEWISQITDNNSQCEYYLADAPEILRDAGHRIYVFESDDEVSTFTGISTQAQLAEVTMYMRHRINLRHMENGVRMLDPATTYIDDMVEIAPNVVIYPGCILEGACKIAEGAMIGPYAHMLDTAVGKGSTVRQSVLTGAKVGENTTVGPYAYLRPGAVIGDKCRIGNFVEVKNSNIGDGTAMAHLAYIGDADVGRNVNYSCGAITANYDGKNKHRTVIADGAFIGCNASMVAPLTVGEGALVTAGSTITEDVPADCMSFGRARQVNKEGRAKR